MSISSKLLTEICDSLKNNFEPSSKRYDLSYRHYGTYTIENGVISNTGFLKEGQYFRIVGSILNDGVYQNTTEGLSSLTDEMFAGALWEMAIPPSFIALCEDIQAFRDKCAELSKEDKGFQSENLIGVYSYTLSSSAPAYLQEWSKRISSHLKTYQKI